MIRVFPRRTKWTPTDYLAYVGDPPLWEVPDFHVFISVTFTWDIPEGQRLLRAWRSKMVSHYPNYTEDSVVIGGPALNNPGGDFTPGLFIKEGVTITSRGCIRKCLFCLVPQREGKIRELPIKDGWIVQDNNLLACGQQHIDKVFDMLERQPHPADFAAGLDARLLKPWHVDRFKSLRSPRLWFACDDSAALVPLAKVAGMLNGIANKFCYALIGHDPNETIPEAEKRLRAIWELGFYPFAMLYRGPNGEGHKSTDWKQFQRTWCRPAAYKSVMKNTPGAGREE